ncbi:MAG: efflux RND transporter permease subunit [Candidatus Moranbacteria bacterium]|nr:efflux RND transporter permease subunit [Candidatus Moranbacteria bacterium]
MKIPERETSSDSHYLEQLTFDPKLRGGFFDFFVTRTRIVILLIILISAWGAFSYSELPRESNPEVKIPLAIVTTAFPGASPGDVEELVTKKMETAVSSLKGVSKISSTSENSMSVVTVEFEAGEDLTDSVRRVRDAADGVKADLPPDAEDPTTSEISFDDQPILTIALTGPYDGFVLRESAEILQDAFEKLPGVREVHVSGGDEREFSIDYDPGKLAARGLSPIDVNRMIAAANLAVPGGNFEGSEFSYPVRSDGRIFSADDLRNLPVGSAPSGSPILLRDIATVSETAMNRNVFSRLSIDGSEPENAITIDIVKKTGGSIIDTVDAARALTEELLPTFPEGIRSDVTLDFAEYIRKDFDQLRDDFFITLALVMGTLFLIIGLKEAIIAGLAIPLVFFSTFGVMLMTGTSLNFLSLFSLLLSLGLLVDDAIVVVSATKQYLRSGKFTPEEAVLLVLRDFRIVLLSTTLATTFAFLPLLLSSGIMGEFIKSIPITVSVTLLSSLLIALIINHPLAAALERIRFTGGFFSATVLAAASVLAAAFLLDGIARFAIASVSGALLLFLLLFRFRGNGKAILERNRVLTESELRDDQLIKEKLRLQGEPGSTLTDRIIHGIVGFERVIPIYETALRFILSTKKRRITTLFGVAALFIGSVLLPVFGIVKSEFFPASDEKMLFINITATDGLNVTGTDTIVRQIEEKLREYPEVKNFSTIVGRPGLSSDGSSGGSGDSSNEAGVVVNLSDPEDRDITSYDLATRIRAELPPIGNADITVESPRGGPPAGAAFEARLVGDDLGTLSETAETLRNILAEIPGTVNAELSLREAPAEFTFALDHERLGAYGLDAATVGTTLRMAVSGTEVSTILRDGEEISIVARFDARTIPTLASVQNIEIVNRGGSPILLRDIADIELRPSVNAIDRLDQKRVVTISSGVEGIANPQDIMKIFQERTAVPGILPDGYVLEYGGENEENEKSVQSIINAMAIAAALIVTTLVIQFNSFRKAMIVLITLPLALIGVFVGMAIFGVSLSFPGLIGILALFGIVVKNAIILIDKINLNLRSGIRFDEAIVDAGKSRIEAIVITSICTIFGIVPITLSNELWQALGTAIIFGLSLSSFLTLFLVPLLFRMTASRRDRNG